MQTSTKVYGNAKFLIHKQRKTATRTSGHLTGHLGCTPPYFYFRCTWPDLNTPSRTSLATQKIIVDFEDDMAIRWSLMMLFLVTNCVTLRLRLCRGVHVWVTARITLSTDLSIFTHDFMLLYIVRERDLVPSFIPSRRHIRTTQWHQSSPSSQHSCASSKDMPLSFESCLLVSVQFFLGSPGINLLCIVTLRIS